tara:strand:- start:1440 stop:2432 length:993 start_codon:yes stop_codon:yes gene_type:complete
MSKVKINSLPSSVIFTQGKREVTVGRNHLPLISGVISAVYTAKGNGLGSMGIARTKAFTSLAIPQGYKGRNNLLDCAKDSAELAAGKRLIEKNGMIFKGSDNYRMIAEAIVDYVNKSNDFKKADAKTAKSGGKRVAKKSNKLKKFRVGDDGKLVRLTRGKPSPFWTIVQAPENAEGLTLTKAKDSEGFKLVQEAGEKTEKVNKPRKSAKAKGISTEEVAAMVTSQVAEIVKDLPVGNVSVDMTEVLEMLTKMQNEIITVRQVCNSLKTKVDFQSNEIVKLSSKLDKLTGKSSTSKKKNEDSRKAKEDAKLKAMADLSSISEEFANIVTKL